MKSAAGATLIATVAGTCVWLFGVSGRLWPAHPMLVTLLLTVVIYVVVKRSWPQNRPR